jgi:hypothetical protein
MQVLPISVVSTNSILLENFARADLTRLSTTCQLPRHGLNEDQLQQGKALGYGNFHIKIGYPQLPAYDPALVRAVITFAPEDFTGSTQTRITI